MNHFFPFRLSAGTLAPPALVSPMERAGPSPRSSEESWIASGSCQSSHDRSEVDGLWPSGTDMIPRRFQYDSDSDWTQLDSQHFDFNDESRDPLAGSLVLTLRLFHH